MMTRPFPPSVNWHIWAACNMNCRFCFAVFNDVKATLHGRPSIDKTNNILLAKMIGSAFAKVSVAGGEALLCPYLVEILASLKSSGTTTALITKRARLIDNPELLCRLAPHLDWIGISIDSFNPEVQIDLGRAKNGRAYRPEQYVELALRIKKADIRLKVNSVVTKLTIAENMTPWIKAMGPERWKVFQVLPIDGQNDGRIEDLLISEHEFKEFVARHRRELGAVLIPESNEAMTGSYAMIDPAGRFFDNVSGSLRYSQPIHDTEILRAWQQVQFCEEKFRIRGGEYRW